MFYEGNLTNISPTIPLDISIKPGVVENVHIGASCSHDELSPTSLFSKNFVMSSHEICLHTVRLKTRAIEGFEPIKLEPFDNTGRTATLFIFNHIIS
jgi:hypothetical protein